ncbi:MAG: glycosyltransferase family 4 protein [Chloroflexi bacterium]|nr:glycosyltransferase family 4 protein [Chloroflexota bacterium]
MKIALVYDAVYPNVKGGAERRFFEIGRRLAAQHDVHIVSFAWWADQPRGVGAPGVTYTSVGRPLPLYRADGTRSATEALRFGLSVAKPIFAGRYDVIDCASFPYFSVLTGSLAARLSRTPMLVTWLEHWGRYWQDYWGWKGMVGRMVENASVAATQRAIAISEFTRRRLLSARFAPSPERVSVIYNGVDFAAIDAAPLDAVRTDIVYVGRLLAHKRVDLLLRAARILRRRSPNLRLVIVGDGPELPSLVALARSLGLSEAVTFLGFIPEARIHSIFKTSRVLVLPSEREGLGATVLEANAAGTPAVVVRSAESAAVDLVVDGVTGFTCAPDPVDLARSIECCLDLPPASTSEACQAFARRYEWNDVAQRVLREYERARAAS